MPFILSCKDIDYYPQEEWDLGSVLAKRRALLYTEPLSSKVMRCNKWLCERTDELTFSELIDIWSHSMWCVYCCYQDPECDRELQHEILLNLRKHFHEYLKLPERYQEKFWPMWSFWYGRFLAELAEEEECGHA